MGLNVQDLRPLTLDNLGDVYQLYEKNEKFFRISKNDIENHTLGDETFNPILSLVYYPSNSEKPVAALIGVIKKSILKVSSNLTIKVFIVDSAYRRKKIGTYLFEELIRRAKPLLSPTSFVNYGFSPPQFMQPGVDVRHTSLLFFLESMGLKRRKPRNNLSVEISDNFPEPKDEKNGFTFQRITPEYFEVTLKFVGKEFLAPSWPGEVKLTFSFNPQTTFIGLDPQKNVVGFASHDTCFTGSFGPTGVLKTVRGKGIGGELLKWCLWDIKKQGSDICTIMYVVGDTVKYYSKTVGAYIGETFIPMSRSIKKWRKLK